MSRSPRPRPRRVLAAIASVILIAGASSAYGDRPWSAADSIAVRYFGEAPFDTPGRIVPAPSGAHFFVITWHGDLESDANVYDLDVFSVAQFGDPTYRAEPRPTRRVTFQSTSNAAGISNARWLTPTSIAFLGADGSEPPQVYKLGLEEASAQKLTNAPGGVFSFDSQGSEVVFIAGVDRSAVQRYPAQWLPSDAPYFLFRPPHAASSVAVFAYDNRGTRQVGPTARASLAPYFRLWMAPNGQQAVVLRPAPADSHSDRWQSGSASDNVPRTEFALIDLSVATARSLLDAPTGWSVGNYGAVEALWSPDSRHVVLTNTMSTRDTILDDARVVFFDTRNRTYSIVTSASSRDIIRDVRWTEPGQTLALRFASNEERHYSQENGRWRRARGERSVAPANSVPLTGGFEAAIVEGDNNPPNVQITHSGISFRLYGSDPALTGVQYSDIERVTWRDRSSAVWTGCLSFPHGDPTGRTPPLVVQIYPRPSSRFLPDGPAPTAYAAQALNARGFAVLQMPFLSEASTAIGTPNEVAAFQMGLEGAIRFLSDQYQLPPSAIGIVGYSRGGFVVKHLVTNTGNTRIAAAVAADAFGASYFEYMMTWRNPAHSAQFDNVYGGAFWEHQDQWLAREPSFNASRVTAPLLLTPIGPTPLISDLQLYGAIRLNHRAADILYFPEGDHNLVRPRERLASLNATLDWMTFWLADAHGLNERSLARWSELRAQHCRTVPQAPVCTRDH